MHIGQQGAEDPHAPERGPVEAASLEPAFEDSSVAGILAGEVQVHEINRVVVAPCFEGIAVEGGEIRQHSLATGPSPARIRPHDLARPDRASASARAGTTAASRRAERAARVEHPRGERAEPVHEPGLGGDPLLGVRRAASPAR